jgi:DNA uptake protein ComE-like DNA-binding protein
MRRWEKIALAVSLSALSLCLLFALLRVACESPAKIGVIEKWQALPEPRINLNRAEPAEIALLPGIGEKRAKEIVRKREEKGPLSAPDVAPLIGAKTFKKVENYISFSD